ncbi:MAG: hypothetical protein GY822_10575 [Deltaproteobacteria bacterium]|nr:hypothetical protein [Deltaproteobacteria bacterium]
MMERLVAGDRSALAVLYDRHASLLLGVGCKMIRDRAEAEDILHDVFMKAWAKAKTYDAARGRCCACEAASLTHEHR